VENELSRNERRTLSLLFRRAASTQLQIAERLEVTQQSASRLLAQLLRRGMIEAGERVGTGQRGYPSTRFHIDPSYGASFGFSVNAGGLSAALVDFAGGVLARAKAVCPVPDRETVLDWVDETLAAFSARFPHLNVSGVGIAISGSFMDNGRFNTPYSLEAWADVDIASIVAERLRLPIYVDNDGNLAALAESLTGIGIRIPSFAYLYIGSGVGGGVVLDGEVWRGRHGNAGEFAGGLEPALNPFPSLELLRRGLAVHGKSFESIEDMLSVFDPRWPAVDEWIVKVHDSVSIIASNAAAILDIDAIVLGGRIPQSMAEKLRGHIRFFDQQRRSQKRPVPAILVGEAPGDAATLGAAILPIRERFHHR
jgi:predicted NBD/HSP70 family sugar kinase